MLFLESTQAVVALGEIRRRRRRRCPSETLPPIIGFIMKRDKRAGDAESLRGLNLFIYLWIYLLALTRRSENRPGEMEMDDSRLYVNMAHRLPSRGEIWEIVNEHGVALCSCL